LRKLRAVTAYENGVTMFFESYDVRNAQKAVSYMLSNFRDYKVNRITFENFNGFELTSEKTHYAAFYYLASEKNIYLIGVGARRKDNETLSRFLNSVRLNSKPVFKISAGKTDEPGKTLSILDLRETPVEFGLLSKDEKKELESKSKEATSDKKDDDEKDTDDKKELIVLFKPRASYTDLARQNMEQGKVVFRVTFTAEGKVRKVSVVRNLKYGLTEEAFRAIRRIRFIPAEKDNAAVEATKTVEYSFTIY
jgi:TonB family protein